jgi:hypothetical protein
MDEYSETEKPQGESIFKELQEKCHNLEIELEYAKQNEFIKVSLSSDFSVNFCKSASRVVYSDLS